MSEEKLYVNDSNLTPHGATHLMAQATMLIMQRLSEQLDNDEHEESSEGVDEVEPEQEH